MDDSSSRGFDQSTLVFDRSEPLVSPLPTSQIRVETKFVVQEPGNFVPGSTE